MTVSLDMLIICLKGRFRGHLVSLSPSEAHSVDQRPLLIKLCQSYVPQHRTKLRSTTLTKAFYRAKWITFMLVHSYCTLPFTSGAPKDVFGKRAFLDAFSF